MLPDLEFDIVICGAGPAGSACALALSKSGLRVALVEKSSFPRDKICGDAIPGRAVKALKELSTEYYEAFLRFAPKLATRNTAIYYKGKSLSFQWVGEAYTSARIHFDDFLYQLVAAQANTTILQDTRLAKLEREHGNFLLHTNKGLLKTRLLVGADGAQSVVARQLTQRTVNKHNHVGSIRAYYTGVEGLDTQTTEVYFDRRFQPSYLWIFPIHGGLANVGFGMLSAEIVRRRLNLKQVFHEFVATDPMLQRRLKNASLVGDLSGFSLPLGGQKTSISGEGWLLTGDAASLIDPMSGDGIGNAMVSGILAAKQAQKAFAANNFSADYMNSYDAAVNRRLGGELRTHYRTRNLLASAPWLLDMVFAASRIPGVAGLMQKLL